MLLLKPFIFYKDFDELFLCPRQLLLLDLTFLALVNIDSFEQDTHHQNANACHCAASSCINASGIECIIVNVGNMVNILLVTITSNNKAFLIFSCSPWRCELH